jgi:DNA transformation protein and related proteins
MRYRAPMARVNPDFVNYCCELLAPAGPCTARRMFGGFGISTGGLTFALVADLGGGEKLWLKSDAETNARFEAAGCERFSYQVDRGRMPATHSLNYYSAPEEAMESPALMAPWSRLSMEAALKARAAKPKKAPAKKVAVAAKTRTAPAARKKPALKTKTGRS